MLNVTAVGNLGGDAEVKNVNGTTCVEFSVATEVRRSREKITHWVRCSYWGKPAEAVAQFLTKGKTVAITGQLDPRMYEGKNGTGLSLDLRVDNLKLCGGGRGGDDASFNPDDLP